MTEHRGTVTSLQICPGHRQPMNQKQSRAITNLGLEGDQHAKQGSARQVLFMDEETLAAGTRLRVGGAVFQITKSCAPCDFIDGIHPGLRAEMDGQRGMLRA